MSDNNTPWPAPVPREGTHESSYYGESSMQIDNSHLAGFWVRFGAHLLDNLTVGLVDLPFRLIANAFDRNGNTGMANLFSFAGIAASLYVYSYWTGVRGGSPLRRRIGVYIVDQDTGSFIGMRRGLKRILMSYVSALAVLIGYFWMMGNPRRQTWHDIVAKSVVIRR